MSIDDRLRDAPHVFMPSFAPHLCSVCEHNKDDHSHDPEKINEHLRDLTTRPSVGDPNDLRYRDYIRYVADQDVMRVLEKDKAYGASWKRRGGVGAFFAFVRKLDRLEKQIPGESRDYDVFRHLMDAENRDKHPGDESLLDTIRDIRGYLLLWEAEHTVRVRATEGWKSEGKSEATKQIQHDICPTCKKTRVTCECICPRCEIRWRNCACIPNERRKRELEIAKTEQPPDLVCHDCGAKFYDLPMDDGKLISHRYPEHRKTDQHASLTSVVPKATRCRQSNCAIPNTIQSPDDF